MRQPVQYYNYYYEEVLPMDDDVKQLLQQMNEGIQQLVNAQIDPPNTGTPDATETTPDETSNQVSEQLEELTELVSSLANGTDKKETTDDEDDNDDKGKEDEDTTIKDKDKETDYIADMIEL